MSGPVKVVVMAAARPSSTKEVEVILRELCAASRKEEGCTGYEVLRNEADANLFVLIEEWASEAHLDAHNKTSHVAKAIGAVMPLLAKPPEIARFAVVM